MFYSVNCKFTCLFDLGRTVQIQNYRQDYQNYTSLRKRESQRSSSDELQGTILPLNSERQ